MKTSETARMFIDGRWCEADDGTRLDVLNPADETVVARVAYGGRAEAERAIDAAARAFRAWSATPAVDRGRVLKRAAELMRARADELARTLTLEQGKPLGESRGEVSHAADEFEWFAEEGRRAYGRIVPASHPAKRHFVVCQPVGVVGTITPWNFPAALPCRKIAPALAAGCTVVSRPADQTPLVLVGIFECLEEAELPPGVANLVIGDPHAVADAFFTRPEVRKISFTGSTAVGKELIKRSAEQVKKLSLELGGHAPLIVCPDVDPDRVARQVVASKFRNCGQVCIAPSRFYVHRDVGKDLVEAVVASTRALRVGPGLEPGVEVGPMIEPRFVDHAGQLVGDARAHGAELLTGGGRDPGHDRGYFFAPTVMRRVDRSMRIMVEEPFAPILPLADYDDFDRVIEEANNTPYGLAAYVYTNDMTLATRLAEALEAGIVGINDPVPTTVQCPFGGMKESGLGRELGKEGLDAFLETKYISVLLKPS